MKMNGFVLLFLRSAYSEEYCNCIFFVVKKFINLGLQVLISSIFITLSIYFHLYDQYIS